MTPERSFQWKSSAFGAAMLCGDVWNSSNIVGRKVADNSDTRRILMLDTATGNLKNFDFDVMSPTEKGWFNNKCSSMSQCGNLSSANQDIVNDGGAENDLRLLALRLAEVLKHPGCDPHAGRGQGRADEPVGHGMVRGEEPGRNEVAQHHRRDDAEQRHHERREPDRHHLLHVGPEPDFEQIGRAHV